MAKKPSQKSIWVKSAKAKLDILRSIAQWPAPRTTEETDIAELEEIIPRSRRFKTAKGRSSAWLSVFQNRILALMRRLGKVEMTVNRTFVMLKPNLKMGTDDAGKVQHDALVKKYGKQWTIEHAQIVERHYPDVRVVIMTYNEWCEESYLEPGMEIIDAHVEMEYVFIGKGTTEQELEWTEALGNKITVDISDIPARFKAGKPRKGK